MLKKITLKTVQNAKNENKKLSMLTAYDYSTAKYIDEAGIDMILVGDSLAMVALGYETTHHAGIDEMKIFTSAVCRGAKRSFVVADMPFMSYHANVCEGVKNAGELIKCGAGAVKIEGCSEHILNVVQRCTASGIPVMGHLGFTPQFINTLGGYNVQGKSYDAALQILEQAQKLEKAGAFGFVLEMMPEESAKYITDNLCVPTISCGAGRYCDGQVIVCDDMLGKYPDFKPKFARKYGDMRAFITDCASRYDADVKSGRFPADEEIFTLGPDEAAQLNLHCHNL